MEQGRGSKLMYNKQKCVENSVFSCNIAAAQQHRELHFKISSDLDGLGKMLDMRFPYIVFFFMLPFAVAGKDK